VCLQKCYAIRNKFSLSKFVFKIDFKIGVYRLSCGILGNLGEHYWTLLEILGLFVFFVYWDSFVELIQWRIGNKGRSGKASNE
jgi:hypothetical protein